MEHPFDIIPAGTIGIDWQCLCKTEEISTQAEAVLGIASREDKLWPGLLKITCQQLRGKSSKRIHLELGRLKAVLDARLGLMASQQAYWQRDYALFCRFILRWAGHPVEPFILDESIPERDEAQRRYDDLLEKLLRERGWMLMDEYMRYRDSGAWPLSKRQYAVTEAEVNRWEKELDSLSQLACQPQAEAAGQRSGFAASFLKAALEWLVQLLHFFSPFKDEPANALDSLAVLNRIGLLARRYRLVPMLKEKDVEDKLSFYQHVNELDIAALRKVNGSDFKPSSLLPSLTISQLKNKAKADLNTLTVWSSARLNEVLFFYSEEASAEGLAKLLAAFNLLREEVHHVSSELYACRMQAEHAWRHNKHYLQQLDAVDKELILVEDNLIKLQRDWLEAAKDNAPCALFRKGCDCLEVLLSEEMLQLEAVSWAEQSCYNSGLSEDSLQWEMKRRNQRQTPSWYQEDEYRYYHPRHVFTQTDYLMTLYAEGQDAALRKKCISIHPDKLARELKAIAEYCSDKVNMQRKRYIHVSRAWYAGQWFAPPPSPEGEAGSSEHSFSHRYGAPQEFRQQEPTLIEKPEAPFGFGLARLHQAYLNWANGQPSLDKSTRGSLGLQHSLYEGDGGEGSINKQMNSRRYFLDDEREMLRLQARQEELDAEMEEIRAQTAAVRQKEKEAIAAAKQAIAARKEAEARAEQAAAARKEAERQLNVRYRKSLMKKLRKKLDTLVSLPSKEIEAHLQAICAEKAADFEQSPEYVEKLLSTLLAEEPQLAALKQKLNPEVAIDLRAGSSAAGLFGVSRTGKENNEDHEPAQENPLSHS